MIGRERERDNEEGKQTRRSGRDFDLFYDEERGFEF